MSTGNTYYFILIILLSVYVSKTTQQEITFSSLNKTIQNDIINILNHRPVREYYTKRVFREDINFYVATRQNRQPELMHSFYNVITEMPTKIIIHGWLDNITRVWPNKLTNAYLNKGDYQIILLDWNDYAFTTYSDAANNAKQIGQILGQYLVESRINLDHVHVVGHSLGSQVAGFAGKKVFRMTGRKIYRISALDAPGPLFEGRPEEERLCDKDAQFVDATHTDIGICGFSSSFAMVDFYPNGGSAIQPGCPRLTGDKGIIYPYAIATVFCSHIKCLEYFTESVNGIKYTGIECHSYLYYKLGWCRSGRQVVYGDDLPMNARGKFYFKTSNWLFPKSENY